MTKDNIYDEDAICRSSMGICIGTLPTTSSRFGVESPQYMVVYSIWSDKS